MIKIFHACEHFKFWCPVEYLDKSFPSEICFLKWMCDSDPNNIGRLARKPATGLFKLHSTEPVEHFLLKKSLKERLILQNVLDSERSTCGHSVEIFRQGCQTCTLVVEKIFFWGGEKHTFPKKISSCMNVLGSWEKIFCRNSCECFQNFCQKGKGLV